MSRVLAIDPGSTESAYALIEADTCQPVRFAKVANEALLDEIDWGLAEAHTTAVEMVASYGMAVGAEVFQTCVWVGRFTEAIRRYRFDRTPPQLVYRLEVKTHVCHDSRAKDSNIRQALVDRFAPGASNHGKGTKADPGFFHGFHSDVWAAFAVAVTVADREAGR